MPQFKDNAERIWVVEINVATIKRVKSTIDIDLLEVLDENSKLIQDLANNAVLLVDLIYVICKPAADAAGISDIDFGEAMAGDVIGDATGALLDAIADFFPAPKRSVLKKMAAKIEEAEKLGAKKAEQILDGLDLEAEIQKAASAGG